MVDFFTKWCKAIALRTTDSISVAKCIVDTSVCRWGAPLQLHYDRGSNFESALMQGVCRCLGIDKSRTTAYHPEGNGQVERTNRSLKSLLRALVVDNKEWDDILPRCVLAYNGSIYTSTGQTPSLLWTGREIRLPADLRLVPNKSRNLSVNEYVVKLRDSIRRTEVLAREHLATAQRRQKEYYDKKAHGAPFKEGKRVWLHVTVPPPGVSTKRHREWSGPFVILQVLSNTTCLIKDERNTAATPKTVHFNRLKPYESNAVTADEPVDLNQVSNVRAEVEIPYGSRAPEAELI